jgi:hypothetical protein
VSSRSERIGANEALFREVNERIGRIQEQFGQTQSFEIVCECGQPDCEDRFQISHEAYRRLRSKPIYFAIAPGHEVPTIERVIERNENYLVVEKTDEDAVEAAEETA